MNDLVPACWSWEVPPFRTTEELIAADLTAQVGLPLDRQVPRDALEFVHHDPGLSQLTLFHAGRCAVCGLTGEHLVDDHCHETGQTRGRLCRSCNVREGRSSEPVFIRYRRLHPAAILNVHSPYHGLGWHLGWCTREVGGQDRAYDLARRPATPWPVWSREDAQRVSG